MTLCSSPTLFVLMLIIQPNLMLHNTRGRTKSLRSTRIKQFPIRIGNLHIFYSEFIDEWRDYWENLLDILSSWILIKKEFRKNILKVCSLNNLNECLRKLCAGKETARRWRTAWFVRCNTHCFFPHGARSRSRLGPLHYRGCMNTLRPITFGTTPLDE